uniref:ATP synthase complex subunit 8 n=1 Tax=Gonioctena intermedia TaxID=63691 RepID=A0A1L5IYT4_GONIN|nr:ATP synthase F0 subunit 8 [Gonioctena intermedia]APM86019.1 ATP synthase F0 subunit 8 [Gonioctena intermedia]AVX29544.1 ATP synthase F0 subunit 8 [Gonioctena intermedia]AVX29557.1 ATP synthase F0 subunit 8 [Gonioctena intermedia]
MPQMMPLNWLTLFLYFTIIFCVFNIINYYMFLYPIKISSTQKTTMKFNWKW